MDADSATGDGRAGRHEPIRLDTTPTDYDALDGTVLDTPAVNDLDQRNRLDHETDRIHRSRIDSTELIALGGVSVVGQWYAVILRS